MSRSLVVVVVFGLLLGILPSPAVASSAVAGSAVVRRASRAVQGVDLPASAAAGCGSVLARLADFDRCVVVLGGLDEVARPGLVAWTHVDPVSNVTASYTWNDASQVEWIHWSNGTYDDRGDVKEEYGYMHGVGWREHGYTYDLAGRLTLWDVTDQADTVTYSRSTYAYDAAGNRKTETLLNGTVKTWNYDQRNRLLSGPGATYVWKARGVLDRQTVSGVLTTYGFDSLGRLITSTAGTTLLSYWYDSFDRLTHQRTGPTANPQQKFAYAGMQQGTIASYGNGQTIAYGRTPGGKLTSIQQLGVPSPTNDRRIARLNRHGDLETLTPAAGGVPTETIRYSPFGERYAQWGADPNPELGYQTQYTNPTSGDVNMQARWYNPGTATFRSRDTYGGDLNTPVSLNRYTYAANNPTRYWDPTGRCVVDLVISADGKTFAYTPMRGPECNYLDARPPSGAGVGKTSTRTNFEILEADRLFHGNPYGSTLTYGTTLLVMHNCEQSSTCTESSAVSCGWGWGVFGCVGNGVAHVGIETFDLVHDSLACATQNGCAPIGDRIQAFEQLGSCASVSTSWSCYDNVLKPTYQACSGPVAIECGTQVAVSALLGRIAFGPPKIPNTPSHTPPATNPVPNYANWGGEFVDDFARLGDQSLAVPFRSDTSHIFRNAAGHLPVDTPANRALIQSAVSPANLRSTIELPGGSTLARYFVTLPDGTQVWAQVRNGAEITNGGVNAIPR